MEIGLGLDSTLNLSLDEQNQLCETAVELGFNSIWTPEGTGQDSYQICLRRWEATTTTSPISFITSINDRRPGAVIPSSFVISIKGLFDIYFFFFVKLVNF